jgi:hypothetical protein
MFTESLFKALNNVSHPKITHLKAIVEDSTIFNLKEVQAITTSTENNNCFVTEFDPVILLEEYRPNNWHFYSVVLMDDYVFVMENALAEGVFKILNTAFVQENETYIATSESQIDETYAEATKNDLRSIVYLVGNMLNNESFVNR